MYCFGKKHSNSLGAEQRVAAADVHPAARQRRAGEHRAEVDLLQHLARARVEGDELAAADGGEVRHAVAHRDAGGDDVAHVAVHRLSRRAAHRGDLRPLVPPALGREVGRGRRHAAARRDLPGRGGARLRAEANGVDAVGEDRLPIGGAAGLQPADRTGQRQHARVVLLRRVRRRAGVERRVPDELAVVGPQEVEPAVLAADPDDLGLLAVERRLVRTFGESPIDPSLYSPVFGS